MFGRLLLLFILVPVIELALFIQLGQVIGLPETLAIIIVTAILGAALTKSQGGKAIASFQQALAQGRMPHREILDGLLILIAGAVLLTPGFLTDTVGFLLLLPPVRAILRQILTEKLSHKVNVSVGGNPLHSGFDRQPELPEEESKKSSPGKVIDI
ncbi:FxsA family protein [Roseibacillus ishigakijimensis]|uniref:FxsA family protein n=1 Tax=Roseibacillus ishigakijimensis TaxID=454146 RepID=A0A934RP51_9BACT|nr:FxsA family protein [Roseibacillus ishigakijimensis]MBK1832991.1 FxsA family protein [Roseibacillus ishigakijimensis]